MDQYNLDRYLVNQRKNYNQFTKKQVINTPIKSRDMPKNKPLRNNTPLHNKQNMNQDNYRKISQRNQTLGNIQIRNSQNFNKNKDRLRSSWGQIGSKRISQQNLIKNQQPIQIKQSLVLSCKMKFSCQNHPSKQAVFMIKIQQENYMFCEKCGAFLATQGFQLKRIQNEKKSIGSNKRQEQVSRFIKNLEILKPALENSINQIQKQRKSVQYHYNQQISKVDNYYDKIILQIENIKNKTKSGLENSQTKAIQLLDIYASQFKDYYEEVQGKINLSGMTQDISLNFQSIIKEVSEDDYRPIMQNYHQKQQFYTHKVEEVKNISNDIKLAKLVYNMSEKNLQNFCKFFQEKYQLKINSVIDNDKNSFSFQKKNKNQTEKQKPKQSPFRQIFEQYENTNNQYFGNQL